MQRSSWALIIVLLTAASGCAFEGAEPGDASGEPVTGVVGQALESGAVVGGEPGSEPGRPSSSGPIDPAGVKTGEEGGPGKPQPDPWKASNGGGKPQPDPWRQGAAVDRGR